jgi:hypothetical protein
MGKVIGFLIIASLVGLFGGALIYERIQAEQAHAAVVQAQAEALRQQAAANEEMARANRLQAEADLLEAQAELVRAQMLGLSALILVAAIAAWIVLLIIGGGFVLYRLVSLRTPIGRSQEFVLSGPGRVLLDQGRVEQIPAPAEWAYQEEAYHER